MRLRRFEFGIGRALPDGVQVYARRGDGKMFFKNYPPNLPDLLSVAEHDFHEDNSDWWSTDAPPARLGLSLVWEQGARLFVGGEADITASALAETRPQLIVSLNSIQEGTRQELAAYLDEMPAARHLSLPMLDVLPKFQSPQGTTNAKRALESITFALALNQTVALHCLMGIHRSVSAASVALAQTGLSPTPRDAFLHIQSRRSIASWIPETVEWMASLQEAERARPDTN